MTLFKYLRLFKAFLRASFVADLEYRMNFVSRIATDVFWYIAQVITFEAIYLHTERLGDWNHDQMHVFLGVLFVTDAIYMILFFDNLDRMSDRVTKGEMDLLLVKPVNSQFMMSLQRMATAIVGNLVIGLAWLGWSLSQLPDFHWPNLFWLLIVIPCGLTALYGIRFIIAGSAVIFTKSNNLQYLWHQLYRLGMRPDSIYAPWLKYVVWTVFPVGLIASVPSRFLLEPPDFTLLAITIGVAAFFLWLSSKFWNYALQFYTSASS